MNKKEIHAHLDEALEREYLRGERDGYQKGVSDGYRRGKAAVIEMRRKTPSFRAGDIRRVRRICVSN